MMVPGDLRQWSTFMEQELRRQTLDRQLRRLSELEQRIAFDAHRAAPDLLQERAELQLIVRLLADGVPAAGTDAAALASAPQHAPQIVWPADGKQMVLVAAGAFLIGHDRDGRSNERPAHEVALPAYYIDRTLVTIGEYRRFLAATGHPAPKPIFPRGWPADYEQHPISGVSWRDACAYAAWAGKRLPSEAEWEKAASWDPATGQKRRYPWGDTWDARLCNLNDSGVGQTTAVGRFSPYGDSPCGAADMAGNLFEWTASLEWNYPIRPGDGRDDLHRPGTRVRRGGSYLSEAFFARTSARLIMGPDGQFLTDGFRCVADIPSDPM
jgi:formylglycine-generating enzyme required for sulfatase activity